MLLISEIKASLTVVTTRPYFSRIGITLTSVRDSPHSKQQAFNREVINPQDGHILCDPNPAICGFSVLSLWWSSRIAKSTIRRPKEILIVLIGVPARLLVVNSGRVP